MVRTQTVFHDVSVRPKPFELTGPLQHVYFFCVHKLCVTRCPLSSICHPGSRVKETDMLWEKSPFWSCLMAPRIPCLVSSISLCLPLGAKPSCFFGKSEGGSLSRMISIFSHLAPSVISPLDSIFKALWGLFISTLACDSINPAIRIGEE